MSWNLRLRSVLVRDRDRCDVERGVVTMGRRVKAYVAKPSLDEVTLWRGVVLRVRVRVVGVARVLLVPVDVRVRLGQLWGVAVIWASAVRDMGLGLEGMEQERGGDMAEIQFCTWRPTGINTFWQQISKRCPEPFNVRNFLDATFITNLFLLACCIVDGPLK